jgi:hypothetical protein
MKKLTLNKMNVLLLLSILFLATNAIAQNNTTPSPCEAKWNNIKQIDRSDSWKSAETVCCGKAQYKNVVYNDNYSAKIYKVLSTGYYFVQQSGYDNMVYYKTLADAERAGFIYMRCALLTNQGRVENK